MKVMKNMRIKKISLVTVLLVTIFIISLISLKNIKAIEKNIINITLSENGEFSPPIFDINDGYLYPGAEITKDFVLKNTTPRKYKIENISLKDFNIKDINGKILDINNYKDLKIIEEFYESIQCSVGCDGIFNNKILYADDIKELIKGKSIQSDISILSGNEKKFNVIVSMKTSAGNNMQGLQANFNIVFNATSISEGTVNNPPIQQPINPPLPPIEPTQPPAEPPVQPPIDPTKPIEIPIEDPDIPGGPGIIDTENPGTAIDSPEGSKPGNTHKDLVQTGSPIDTTTLVVLGLVFVSAGVVVSFKKIR